MTEDTLLDRLARLESGQVSDVLDEAGLPDQALSSAFVPLAGGQRFAGRAACLRGAPLAQGRHQAPSLPADIMEQTVRPGSVLLVETGGFQAGAILGGFVAYSLQRAGCRGIVTDGAVRDADEIRELGLPCLARCVTPINGARRWRLVEAGQPIALAGQTGVPVRIAPGDLVLADADGVVVVPQAVALQIIEDSEELARIERAIGGELRQGGERAAVFKRHPRFDHIRPVER